MLVDNDSIGVILKVSLNFQLIAFKAFVHVGLDAKHHIHYGIVEMRSDLSTRRTGSNETDKPAKLLSDLFKHERSGVIEYILNRNVLDKWQKSPLAQCWF